MNKSLKKFFMITLVLSLLIMTISFSTNDVYALTVYKSKDFTYEYQDGDLVKYVADIDVIEYSQVLTYETAWAGIPILGRYEDTISFSFSQERTEGYSFAWSVGASLEGGVSIPFIAEAKAAASTEVTNEWNQTDSFNSSNTITRTITSYSQEGMYQLQLRIPQTKRIKIDSTWKKYTREKKYFWFIHTGYTEWVKKEISDKDEIYHTFKLDGSQQTPYLELVKTSGTPHTSSTPNTGVGSTGRSGRGGDIRFFLEVMY